MNDQESISLAWAFQASLISCFIVLIFLSSSIQLGDANGIRYISNYPLNANPLQIHTPIRINGNADFASQVVAESWNGSGSVTDPWIIENYEINGFGYGYCIFIGNVTNYFVIRNCTLYNAYNNTISLYQFNTGLYYYNTQNGSSVNNTMYGNDYYGLWLRDCKNISMSLNNASNNNWTGIRLYNVTNTTILDNICNWNNESGIIIAESSGSVVRNNTIIANLQNGLVLQGSSYILVNNVTAKLNVGIGFYLFFSSYGNVTGSVAEQNNWGIYAIISAFFKIFHNDIINNTNQSYDDSFNTWYDTYPSGGNYWSDYTGTDGYSGTMTFVDGQQMQGIPGSDGLGDTRYSGVGSIAYYPIMHPIMRGWTDSLQPNSMVKTFSPYWRSSNITVNATANDTGGSGVFNVSLYSRHSIDNLTWTGWSYYSTDSIAPWSWSFNISSDRHYQFYTIAYDVTGNEELFNGTPDSFVGYDDVAPESHVENINPFWYNRDTYDIVINATANDTIGDGVANTTLWCRYSTDNSTWGGWLLYGYDNTTPLTWDFRPSQDGFYEFYTISIDKLNNTEQPPLIADAGLSHDSMDPYAMYSNNSRNGTTGDQYSFQARVYDNIGAMSVYVTYCQNLSGPYQNKTMTYVSSNIYEGTITIEANSTYPLRYNVVVIDNAGNMGYCTYDFDVSITDNDPPCAIAGDDAIIPEGTTMQFNGLSSVDNIGIVNYTWEFMFQGLPVRLYNATTPFNFTTPGNYTITLTMKDAANNTDIDEVNVTVNALPHPDTVKPTANGGEDIQITAGNITIFNGSLSSDNIGIANFTWTFTYDNATVILYGIGPQFTFLISGQYQVTLNVSDATGNSDEDTIIVFVEPNGNVNNQNITPPAADNINYFAIIIILIVISMICISVVVYLRYKKKR